MPAFTPEDYEAWFRRPLGRLADRAEGRLLSAFGAEAGGGLILDAGCGTGHFTPMLEARGGRVVAMDISLGMLRFARSRRRIARPVAGDVERLPFKPGAFDSIVMLTVLELLGEPGRALAEAHSALRPSGRLLLAYLDRRSPWGILRTVRGRLGHRTWRRVHLFDGAEIEDLLVRSGFRPVKTRSVLLRSYAVCLAEREP